MAEASPAGTDQKLFRIARTTIVVVTALGALTYIAILVLLYVSQRELLFVGGRQGMPAAAYPLYHVRTLREADGTRLATWQSAPPAPGKATIVFFYGNAGTISDFAEIGQEFQREGYGVVLASYRGYAGNSGQPSEGGLMEDARAILGDLPKTYGPIVLWGQSLGTGIAARMASERRGVALILQSPYTSLVDVAAGRFPLFPVRWLLKDRFDTFSVATKINVPVLIMHGTADSVVPFTMGARLSRQFRKVRFVPIPGGGHNDLSAETLFAIADTWLGDNAAAIEAKPPSHATGIQPPNP